MELCGRERQTEWAWGTGRSEKLFAVKRSEGREIRKTERERERVRERGGFTLRTCHLSA